MCVLRKHKQRWKVKSTSLLSAGSPAAAADEFPRSRRL